MAACDKTVQILYERKLRPPKRQHEPWIERVQGQAAAALQLLEKEAAAPQGAWMVADRPLQADITATVAWSFISMMIPELAAPDRYPALAAFAARAERLPEFIAAPLVEATPESRRAP